MAGKNAPIIERIPSPTKTIGIIGKLEPVFVVLSGLEEGVVVGGAVSPKTSGLDEGEAEGVEVAFGFGATVFTGVGAMVGTAVGVDVFVGFGVEVGVAVGALGLELPFVQLMLLVHNELASGVRPVHLSELGVNIDPDP